MTAKQIGKFSSGNAAYALFYPEKDSSQSANFFTEATGPQEKGVFGVEGFRKTKHGSYN